MKKFVFSLAKVLSVKENSELKAKQEYAKVLQEKIKFENENKSMLSTYFTDICRSSTYKPLEILSAEDLIYEGEYLNAVELQIEQNKKEIVIVEKNLKPLFENLVEATREKKKYEKLKEKELEAWKKDYNKLETAKIDELSLNMHISNKRILELED